MSKIFRMYIFENKYFQIIYNGMWHFIRIYIYWTTKKWNVLNFLNFIKYNNRYLYKKQIIIRLVKLNIVILIINIIQYSELK